MGYYIETNSPKGKAKWLVDNAKGVIVDKAMPTRDSIPVVVLDNGPFEAAGIAYNARELIEFVNNDYPRPHEIVMVPREEVLRLVPQVENLLGW